MYGLGFIFFKGRSVIWCNNCSLHGFCFLCFYNSLAEDILNWLFFKEGNAQMLEFDYFCKIFVMFLLRTST